MENHRPVVCHWQTLSHNVYRVHIAMRGFELTTFVFQTYFSNPLCVLQFDISIKQIGKSTPCGVQNFEYDFILVLKKQPIRMLYTIYQVFWLDDYSVRVWNSYWKLLTVRPGIYYCQIYLWKSYLMEGCRGHHIKKLL